MIKFGNFLIKRFWIVISVSFILLVTGLYGFNNMPKKNLPNINPPFSLTTFVIPNENNVAIPGGISIDAFEADYLAEFEELTMNLEDVISTTLTISTINEGTGYDMNFGLLVAQLDGSITNPAPYWETLSEQFDTQSTTFGWDSTNEDLTLRNVIFDADFNAPQGSFWVSADNTADAVILANELEAELKDNVSDIVEVEIFDGTRMNNGEAAILTYFLKDGIDQTKTRHDITNVIDDFNATHGSNTITTLSSEPDDVAAAIGGVMVNLIMALLIVGLVVFFGLGLMNALGVLATIPVIILATSAFLWIVGSEVNTFTIAGIIISIGILVDNSIVISDSIQARIDRGSCRTEASVKAIRDNWVPVAAATATTVAAFMPMMFLPGIVGNFLFMLPFTVVVTITASYIFAMTLMPVLASMLFTQNKKRAAKNDNNELGKVEAFVSKTSKWTLLHPIKTVFITVATLVGSIMIVVPNLEFELLPQAEINAITISYTDENADPVSAQTTHDEIVSVLDQYDWVDHYASTVGGQLPTFSSMILSSKLQDFEGSFVIWVDDDYTKMGEYSEILNNKLEADNIGVKSNIVEMSFPGPSASVSLSLEGVYNEADFIAMEATAQAIYDEMITKTEFVSEATIALPSNGAAIRRVDGKRVLTIELYGERGKELSIERELTKVVDAKVGSSPYASTYGGTSSENSSMFGSMMNVFMVAIVIILGILIAQFRSIIKPFMVLSLVPFSFIGVLWIFLITGYPLSTTGMLGVIALTGLVVNAGILLVEQVRDGKKDGLEPIRAIEEAVMKRFRPIVISSLTTIVGLIPLTLSNDPFFTPMSLIMIGGLLTSTFLALFTFPALLTFVTKPNVNKEHKKA